MSFDISHLCSDISQTFVVLLKSCMLCEEVKTMKLFKKKWYCFVPPSTTPV